MHVFTSFLNTLREGISNSSPVKSNSFLIFNRATASPSLYHSCFWLVQLFDSFSQLRMMLCLQINMHAGWGASSIHIVMHAIFLFRVYPAWPIPPDSRTLALSPTNFNNWIYYFIHKLGLMNLNGQSDCCFVYHKSVPFDYHIRFCFLENFQDTLCWWISSSKAQTTSFRPQIMPLCHYSKMLYLDKIADKFGHQQS